MRDAVNDIIAGEDNWNFEVIPWYYSGAKEEELILESNGNGNYIFSFVYAYDDEVPMRKEYTLLCGFDTGHMEFLKE